MESTIGPYYLVRPLGGGGMGTLWRARHRESGMQVALKTLKAPSQSLARSLRREIQALAQLTHPGIIRILDEGLEDGIPWYAMEIIEGKTLREWGLSQPSEHTSIEDATRTATELALATDFEQSLVSIQEVAERPLIPLTSERLSSILNVVRRLCAPLAYLHGEGFVHRDLKPDNILIRPREEPVLVDFGLARAERKTKESLQIDHGISGTVFYMSPEQIQGEPLDARADLYSLGVILFELLSGRRPFDARLPFAVMQAHLTQQAPALSSLVENIPVALERLVQSLLSKSRRDRPGYAEDVSRELSALGAERSMSAGQRPRLYLYRSSFVGRIPLLQSLRAAVSRVEKGEGGLIMIEGARGEGKTRLAAELAQEAVRRRLRVLAGDCQSRQDGVAINGLRRPLQEIEDQCREVPERAEQVLGRHAQLLSLYQPSLSLRFDSSSPPPVGLPPELAHRRLFVALAEVLYAYADGRPLLLLIDDLQWADPLTLGFLRFLCAKGPLSRLLLVVGFYTGSEGLAELLSENMIDMHRLSPLLEEEAERMAFEMLSSTPPKTFLQELYRSSRGNPGVYTEQLISSVERGVFRRDAAGRWVSAAPLEENNQTLSSTLEALLNHRLSGVSAPARRLLSALSIFEREAPLAALERVMQQTSQEELTSIAELTRRGLIVESPVELLSFSHHTLRELCYSAMTGEQKRALHSAAAEALEGIYAEGERKERAVLLARHWQEAGELELAQGYYLLAARRAAGLHMHKEAERLYRIYLGGAKMSDEKVCARNELGEKILYLQGRLSEAAEEHERAIHEAHLLSLTAREAESLRFLGLARWRQGRMEEAESHYQHAMGLVQESKDRRLEAALLRNMASIQHSRGNLEKARLSYEQALSLHQEINDRSEEGKCLGNLAVLYHDLGRLDEAYELYARALVRHKEANELRLEGICLCNLAGLHQQRSALQQASDCYERALQIAREVGDLRLEALAITNLGVLSRELGQLTRAKNLLLQALHMHREASVQSEEGRCLFELAEIERWENNNITRAEELCQQSEVCIAREGDKLKLARLWCLRGHLCLAQRESAEIWLGRAKLIAAELQTTEESELSQKIEILERAQRDFVQDRPLFRGQRVEDIPAPLKRWLLESSLIP